MAQQVTLADANTYFGTYVLHSDAWDEATDSVKQKALNQAEKDLYEVFTDYDINDPEKQLPNEAIYEQALWLLRIDDALQKAEMGVKNLTVEGVSISMSSAPPRIGPRVRQKIAAANGGSPDAMWTVI
jgi:hypothetical protein